MRFDLWKSNLLFVELKNKILLKKKSDLFLQCKKKWDLVCKKFRSVVGGKKKLLKEDSHSWAKLIMHASHVKKKN